jgi:hypothetical protein
MHRIIAFFFFSFMQVQTFKAEQLTYQDLTDGVFLNDVMHEM